MRARDGERAAVAVDRTTKPADCGEPSPQSICTVKSVGTAVVSVVGERRQVDVHQRLALVEELAARRVDDRGGHRGGR